jgi:hypothetical protein
MSCSACSLNADRERARDQQGRSQRLAKIPLLPCDPPFPITYFDSLGNVCFLTGPQSQGNGLFPGCRPTVPNPSFGLLVK